MTGRLLFSLPYGIAFRNIVCCGIVEACQACGADVSVLIPTLTGHDTERLRLQLPARVDLHTLLPATSSCAFASLKFVKQHLYGRRTALTSFRIKHERRRRERPLFHLAATAVERVSELLFSEEWIDDKISSARQPFEDHYKHLLNEARVAAVVLAKPGYQPEDLALIKAARACRIPTISVDTTWDNIVSKRPTYLAPDAMTAWSVRMRNEAVQFYRLRPNHVSVTGGAPFDVFFDRDKLPSRAAYLRGLNLDPSRKLIVFALNSPVYSPQNALYINFLLHSVRSGSIRGSPNVVIRLHPWDLKSSHEELVRNYDRVRLERPFGVPEPGSGYECIPSRDEVLHYGALLTHADVLVNIASTTSLDAIAAGTPVISIAFDIENIAPELSTARLYELSHYKPIVASGAVRVVHSADAFIAAANSYLEDPGLDQTLRENARHDFLTFTDGRSAERIAAAITGLC